MDKIFEENGFELLDDTGIVEKLSNGGRKQDILFASKDRLYKISHLSESIERQSFSILYVKDKNGWTTLLRKNPKRDFGIDIAYSSCYSKNTFNKITKLFIEKAKKIDKVAHL